MLQESRGSGLACGVFFSALAGVIWPSLGRLSTRKRLARGTFLAASGRVRSSIGELTSALRFTGDIDIIADDASWFVPLRIGCVSSLIRDAGVAGWRPPTKPWVNPTRRSELSVE